MRNPHAQCAPPCTAQRRTLAHAPQYTCTYKAVFMMRRAHETLRAACSDGEQHSYERGLEIRLRSSTSHDRVREQSSCSHSAPTRCETYLLLVLCKTPSCLHGQIQRRRPVLARCVERFILLQQAHFRTCRPASASRSASLGVQPTTYARSNCADGGSSCSMIQNTFCRSRVIVVCCLQIAADLCCVFAIRQRHHLRWNA